MKQMIYKVIREIEILDEGYIDNFHYCVVSLGTHPCAYVELPKEHKYYGRYYDDIDIVCHGGLTYCSDQGIITKTNENHKDGYWIGWDYAHYGDYAGYETMYPIELMSGGKRWTTEEILADVEDVVRQLREDD